MIPVFSIKSMANSQVVWRKYLLMAYHQWNGCSLFLSSFPVTIRFQWPHAKKKYNLHQYFMQGHTTKCMQSLPICDTRPVSVVFAGHEEMGMLKIEITSSLEANRVSVCTVHCVALLAQTRKSPSQALLHQRFLLGYPPCSLGNTHETVQQSFCTVPISDGFLVCHLHVLSILPNFPPP